MAGGPQKPSATVAPHSGNALAIRLRRMSKRPSSPGSTRCCEPEEKAQRADRGADEAAVDDPAPVNVPRESARSNAPRA